MPAGMEKKIKLLLLKLNKQGIDTSLMKLQKYSNKFDCITSYYKLTHWKKIFVKKKGQLVEKNVPDTHEFSNQIDLLKYMVVKCNE